METLKIEMKLVLIDNDYLRCECISLVFAIFFLFGIFILICEKKVKNNFNLNQFWSVLNSFSLAERNEIKRLETFI